MISHIFPQSDGNDHSILLLIVLTVLVGVLWVKSQSRKHLPPFPVTPLPILGNALSLDRNPRKQVEAWRKKCGDIFSLYMGPVLLIMLNGYELSKEAFVKYGNAFSDRPAIQFGMDKGNHSYGFSTNCGPSFKELKHFVIPALKQLGMGQPWYGEKILQEISLYLQELDKYNGQPMNVCSLTRQSVTNALFSLMFGKRFEYDDKEFVKVITNMHHFLAVPSVCAAVQFYPFLGHLPGDIFRVKLRKRRIEEINAFFSEHFIDNVEVNSAMVDGKPSNVVSSYFQEMSKRHDSGRITYMSKKDIHKTALDFMGANLDTSSHTILWFVLFCIHHPEVQDKAFQAIKEHVGTERLPNLSDKKNLKYINAILLETWRMGNVAPISLPHVCRKDVKLRGYDIPKGAVLICHLGATCFDKNLWGEDAHLFRPERFIDENGELIQKTGFIPFSIGDRACPGESHARIELYLFIAALIQRFRFLPANPSELPPLKESFNLLPLPPKYEARFVPRNT